MRPTGWAKRLRHLGCNLLSALKLTQEPARTVGTCLSLHRSRESTVRPAAQSIMRGNRNCGLAVAAEWARLIRK